MNVASWLMVRTATSTLRPRFSARSAEITLDLPLPVGASIMAIPPSRATDAATSSISRWWGRYSRYGNQSSRVSIAYRSTADLNVVWVHGAKVKGSRAGCTRAPIEKGSRR